MNSMFVVLPARTSVESANASMVDSIVNSKLASSPTLVGRISMLGSCVHYPSVTWCFISMLLTFPLVVIEALAKRLITAF